MKPILGLPDDSVAKAKELVNPAKSLPKEIEIEMSRFKSGVAERAIQGYSRVKEEKNHPFLPWAGQEAMLKPHLFDREALWLDLATVQGRCFYCKDVCSSISTLIRHLTGPCRLRTDSRSDLSSSWRTIYDIGHTYEVFLSRTAPGLVHATGLDLFTATADEVDDGGAFYKCMRCAPEPKFLGTWRECMITHAIASYSTHEPVRDQNPAEPVFQILADADSSEEKLKDERIYWSCAHFTVNAEELWIKGVVIAHLKDV
ncbi:hypothetical protein V5O48_007476 [Marasmius crinis-equi]|uniref:BED-type domain-containing protein n=1 Tax=Marasmius crinis-equi TaxID=585013 RepID=A0ABR3FGM9_9AGAR